MNVTFTRTGDRRYKVSVDGSGLMPSVMDPAPGYDERMPHDMAHFIGENELGISRWSKLNVGESISLQWQHGSKAAR